MTGAPARTKKRQALIDTLFLAVALTALVFVTAQYGLVMDPDIWFHIRTGDWILTHRTVPVTDTFSWHARGHPWIAYSWLFEVLVGRIFHAAGPRGILALTISLGLAYCAAVTVFLTQFTNLRRAAILAFLAYLALMPLKSPRPWLFTFLFFAIELALLWMARERNRPLWLIPIVPLFVVWANLHIQFVYGLFLLGMFALEASVPAKLRARLSPEPGPALRHIWLWSLLAASCAATLVNPYGWNLYRVVYEYGTQSAPLMYVQEMLAIPFRTLSNWVFLLLTGVGIFALGRAREKSLLLISLMAVACWFGFRSQRDMWFPVNIAVLAWALEMRNSAPGFERSRCIYPIAIPASLLMTLGLLIVDPRFSRKALDKLVSDYYPVEASSWVESHHLPGPLFNSYTWGGYLIWRLPEMPVAIDGRANLYESDIANTVDTMRGEKAWTLNPDLKKARTILLESDGALTSILRVDPQFHLLYEDRTACVFEPVR